MPRLARLVIPGLPHHVTQRGNRRQQTFFCDQDYSAYMELMAQWCKERGVAIWAYCLMPNHIHLIAVPQSEDGLGRAIGEAHRRRINFREKWLRLPMAGAFCFVRDGRAVFAGGGTIRGVECSSGRSGGGCWRLALEQCKSTLVGPRRRIGARRSATGDGWRLARLFEQRDPGGRATRFARARRHWLSLGQCHVCRASGENGRSQAPPRKTRPSVEITQTTIIGSCPRNLGRCLRPWSGNWPSPPRQHGGHRESRSP